MEIFVRHLKILWTSERMLGELKLKTLTQKILFGAAAALSGLFALGMLNLAAYLAMQPQLSAAGAALVVALVNLVITAILITVAQRLAPGPEAKLIGDVRDMAVAGIETEAQAVQTELQLVRDEIVGLRRSVSRVMKNPLEILAPKALLPLIMTVTQLIKGREDTSNAPAAKPATKTSARKSAPRKKPAASRRRAKS